MKNYEAVCILNPRLTKEKVDSILERLKKKITDKLGEVVKVNIMGIRKLPFTFSKHKKLKEALYITIDFKGEGPVSEAATAFLRLQEEVVRFMITIKEDIGTEIETEIVPEDAISAQEDVGEKRGEAASGELQ